MVLDVHEYAAKRRLTDGLEAHFWAILNMIVHRPTSEHSS
jgi:hypothetical protein